MDWPVPRFLTLICDWPEDDAHPERPCGASIMVRKGGELPQTCPRCSRYARWRVALDGELTNADRRLLRQLRISAD